MNEVNKFYESFMQEVIALQLGNDEGDTREQAFTRLCLDYLSNAGETENATVAYDERSIGKRGQHKINGYALSENYENVDLFISVYNESPNIVNLLKSDIETAEKRITNFFRKTIYDDYANDVEESSEIFEFANTLASYDELRDSIVRVNAFILTNGEYKGEIPTSHNIDGHPIFYRVVDINFLYRISEQAHMPIELDFNNIDGKSYNIPCLSTNIDNKDYEAYVAIIPGECLATLYENYGDRLLEQNVRSFLQFTGKINKGIRKTINDEPHMFLAFNNGIAATADHIELDETNHTIKRISNLQIVNGGQTTASIYNTHKRDKADISNIYVQAKISVIKDEEQYADIVSRISKYANTQNKVNDADFSANNPILVEIERLSRSILTPLLPSSTMQTYWFFERARGQYKTWRAKDGFTPSRRKTFDLKYPRNQVITKVEWAKYINSWQEVYNGKKLAIGPHIVVRGNEKNYASFMNHSLPESKMVDIAYFEDSIAKAILFRTADKLYGNRRVGNRIGEIKQVVVPYTLCLLNKLTDGKLDLYKIWKNQGISSELSNFIYGLMKQVNDFILNESPISHYIEWAKKEDCWLIVREHPWKCNVKEIKGDLVDEKNPPKRNHAKPTEDMEETLKHQAGVVRDISPSIWKKIETWGRESGMLSPTRIPTAANIAYKLKNKQKLTSAEIANGYVIVEKVQELNPELLEADEPLVGPTIEDPPKTPIDPATLLKGEVTLELLSMMIEWDKKKRVLNDWQRKRMQEVLDGRFPLNDEKKYHFYENLLKLMERGFPN